MFGRVFEILSVRQRSMRYRIRTIHSNAVRYQRKMPALRRVRNGRQIENLSVSNAGL